MAGLESSLGLQQDLRSCRQGQRDRPSKIKKAEAAVVTLKKNALELFSLNFFTSNVVRRRYTMFQSILDFTDIALSAETMKYVRASKEKCKKQ